MAELKELREKQARLVAQARSKFDEIKDDTPPERAAEIEREYDAIMVDHDKIDERAQKLEKLIAAELVIDRPDPRRPTGEDRTIQPGAAKTIEERHREAFQAYLRNGKDELTAEQRSFLRPSVINQDPESRTAQSAGTANTGGYTVPTGFVAELVKKLKLYGPMLDPGVVREMMTPDGRLLPWPTMDDTNNKGRRIGENTQVNQANLTFGSLNLYAWKYTTDVVLVSSELLQDTALPVEEIIQDAMAERFGRIANDDLTFGTGSGNSQPMGIVTGAGAGYTNTSDTIVSFDDLIELLHSVDPLYRDLPSARFMFNDLTLKGLRKLKDGDGYYIWNPATTSGDIPATILGKPYSINQSMANLGTGNVPIIFGALNRYVKRMVRDFALRRLEERYADFDQVGFIGFGRLDGQILDNSAIKGLANP